MYFKDEKRELQKLKVKPSVWLLAKEIAWRLDPHDEEPDIDKLFQRLIITVADNFKLLQMEQVDEVQDNAHVNTIDANLQNLLSIS